MKRRKVKRGSRRLSIPSGILLGVAISVGMVIGEALVFAGILDRGMVTERVFTGAVPVLLFFASMTGSLIAGVKVWDQKVLVCLVSALCFWLVLLGIPALFFDGQYGKVGICALSILAGGGGALFLSTRKGRRKYR